MKRCAESPSMMGKPEGLQLLWHRMVHDGGVDEYGVIQGPARVIWHSCLALTTGYSVEDCETWLAMMVEDGLLFEYEFGGCTYYATVNHELYSWRTQRAAPTLPMTQEVADTRDFSKLTNDKRASAKDGPSRADLARQRTMQWAERCGITVCLDGCTSATAANAPRNRRECAAQPPRMRGDDAYRVVERGEERRGGTCGDAAEPQAASQPSELVEPEPTEPDVPQSVLDSLHEWGCEDLDSACRQLAPRQIEAAGGSRRVCAVAFAAEARDRAATSTAKPATIMRWKLQSARRSPPDLPPEDYVLEAQTLLGLAPPPRARAPAKLSIRMVRCEACGEPNGVQDDGAAYACIACGAKLEVTAGASG